METILLKQIAWSFAVFYLYHACNSSLLFLLLALLASKRRFRKSNYLIKYKMVEPLLSGDSGLSSCFRSLHTFSLSAETS
jgi:hypothetical protein